MLDSNPNSQSAPEKSASSWAWPADTAATLPLGFIDDRTSDDIASS